MTLTVHFVDSTWKLQSFCLETVPIFEDHTGQNIADAITDVLENWELSPKKLVAFTTDSWSNIVSAFHILDLLRISCFGHNFDLAIRKSLNDPKIQKALSQCHSPSGALPLQLKKNS